MVKMRLCPECWSFGEARPAFPLCLVQNSGALLYSHPAQSSKCSDTDPFEAGLALMQTGQSKMTVL